MAILKDNSGNVASSAKFGGASGVRRFTASKFVPDANWTVTDIDIRINEDTGSPHVTQNIIIKILGNTGTLPNDADQLGGDGNLSGATVGAIGTTFTDFNVSFSSPASLSVGVTYWIALEINTGGSDANYWSSRAITTAAANNGAKFDEDDSGVWANNTDDLYYILNGTASGSSLSAKKALLGVGV